MKIEDVRNIEISNLYSKLLKNEYLTVNEQEGILKAALVFINELDENVKNFGYRILVMYVNFYQDYEILFDIAINSGLIPISKSIEAILDENIGKQYTPSFFSEFTSSYMENYREDDIYLTQQQLNLYHFFEQNINTSVAIIAPTSYGKSSIIISTIKKNTNSNIVIIVPSKALLEQTKKRILDAHTGITKVIVHPEMYEQNNAPIIAVLTQERLLRLLKENKDLSFDIVFVDEAHNLLENNDRNILLASSLTILGKRNQHTKFKFLTPFLISSMNLQLIHLNYARAIHEFKITEYIKSEKVYLYDFRNKQNSKLLFYDHFLDKFFDIGHTYANDIALILEHQQKKNIIYFNRPISIEKFTKSFIQNLPLINSERITYACEELKKHLHKDYYLIDALRHGVVYHHGSIPSYIRIYIEHLFKTEKELKFIITSSTLLEGVNIPAEVLFILDNRKGRSSLTPSQFKNLIGRISRFSEIFGRENRTMDLLEPKIFLIASNYFHKSWKLENFIRKVMKIDIDIQDNPQNPLLKNSLLDKDGLKEKFEAEVFIENFENDTISSDKISYAKTDIGKLCFNNNVTEIDILLNERDMQKTVKAYMDRLTKIDDTNTLMYAVRDIFIVFVKKHDKYRNIARLSHEKAISFYRMFLDWKIHSITYNQMIHSFLRYWQKLIDAKKDTLVYVDKWGEVTRNDGFRPLWIDISNKNIKERVNLAIVRIHDEQEFFENVISKFIDILFELEIVEESFYNNIKYGTSDPNKVALIKNGFSFSLSHLLIDKYLNFISINNKNVKMSKLLISEMEKNYENEILIYEANFNVHD